MRKLLKVNVLLLLFSILIVLSACNTLNEGNVRNEEINKTFEEEEQVEFGLNEISLEELEQKLKNRETFLLLAYSENDEDMERTNFLKAHNQALKDYDLIAYSINLIDLSEDEKDLFVQKYKHPDAKYWKIKYAQLSLVVDGLIGLEMGYRFPVADHSRYTRNLPDDYDPWLEEGKDYFNEIDRIYSGIKDILAYKSDNYIFLDN